MDGESFLEIQGVLKDNGLFYFFPNDFLQVVELQNFINRNTKFVFKQLIIWDKYNSTPDDHAYKGGLYGNSVIQEERETTTTEKSIFYIIRFGMNPVLIY